MVSKEVKKGAETLVAVVGIILFILLILYAGYLWVKYDQDKIDSGCEPATWNQYGSVMHWKNC